MNELLLENTCKRVKFLSETEKNSSKTLPQHSKKRSEYAARDLQNWKGASLNDLNNNLFKKQVTFYFGNSSCKTIPRRRNPIIHVDLDKTSNDWGSKIEYFIPQLNTQSLKKY